MLGAFHDARPNMMWNNRIVLGREGCAVQMDTFADMLRSTAKELEKSLFSDERLEKKPEYEVEEPDRTGQGRGCGSEGNVCGYAPQYSDRAGKKFIFRRASGKKAGISVKKVRDWCTVQQFFPEQ